MLKRSLVSLMFCVVAGFNALDVFGAGPEAVYFDGGQYTASLQQHAHHWHLLPLQGDDVDVIDHTSACANGVHVPHGVWIVTSNQAGQPQLLAPSATALPAGFPPQLQLRACGDHDSPRATDGAAALLVPAVVLDWIKSNVSSVLIDD